MSVIDVFCEACGARNNSADTHCFACAIALDAKEDEEPVAQLLRGRYRLLHQVGTGGFSAVYKAMDTQTSESVAIKAVTLRGLAAQEKIEATDTFNREVELLSVLKHRNLPRLHEHFADAECWYVVMDFVEGTTLEEYLDQQAEHKVTFQEALDIGLLLCDVLNYLHSQQPPIIFRDLKPSNIMLTTSGHLFLLDFGIARRYKPGKAKDTIPFGSKGYAAPEQYGRAQTNAQADIYSLGAILHELLTGHDPSFTPLAFTPLDPSPLAAMKDMNALIQSMVELDAEKRPASIELVQQRLQAIGLAYRNVYGLAPVQFTPKSWRPALSYALYPSPDFTMNPTAGAQMTHATQSQQYYQPSILRNNLAFLAILCTSIGAFVPFWGLLWNFGSHDRGSVVYNLYLLPALLGIVLGIFAMRRALAVQPQRPGYKTARNAIIFGTIFFVIVLILLLMPV